MKTISFSEIIRKWCSKGYQVTAEFSTFECACVKPGDIINVSIREGSFRFVASLCHVYDENPQIHIDRLSMDGDKCVSRSTIRRYFAKLK